MDNTDVDIELARLLPPDMEAKFRITEEYNLKEGGMYSTKRWKKASRLHIGLIEIPPLE